LFSYFKKTVEIDSFFFYFHTDKVRLKKKNPVWNMSEIKQLSELVQYKTKQKKEGVWSLTLTQRTIRLTFAYSHQYMSTIEDCFNSEWYCMQLFLSFYSKHSLLVLLNCFV